MRTATSFWWISLLLAGSFAVNAATISGLAITNRAKLTDFIPLNASQGAGFATRTISVSNLANSIVTLDRNGGDQLKNWRAFKAQREAGSNATIVITTIGASYMQQNFFLGPLFNTAKQLYGDAGPGFLYPFAGSVNYHAATPIITGTWVGDDHFYLPYFATFTSSETNAAVSWTNQYFSTAVLYYFAKTNGGTFTVSTNGSVMRTISSVGAANGLSWTNLAVPIGTNTLTVTNLTGTNVLIGVDLKTGNPGVRAYRHEHSGHSAWEDRTNNLIGDTNVFQKVLTNENPGLVLMALGAGDLLTFGLDGVAGLFTNLSAVVGYVKAAVPFADVVLMSEPSMSNVYNAALVKNLEPIVRAVAMSNSCGYIDTFDGLLTLENPYFSYTNLHIDDLHYNAAGHRQILNLFSERLFGGTIEQALAAARPAWLYEVNWKAHFYGIDFHPLDENTLSPLGLRNSAYVETGTSPSIIVSVPSGQGWSNIVLTVDLEGYTGQTNATMSVQFAADSWLPASCAIVNYVDVTGLTNRIQKSVSGTNSFCYDSGPRELYIRFLDLTHGGAVTNRVYVSRIRLKSL
jgi:hypothetical protein